MKALFTKYQQAQELRTWNARFTAPPVSTGAWTDEDFQRWEDSRKELPPLQEWIALLKPKLVTFRFAGKDIQISRQHAASLVRGLRQDKEWSCKLVTVRSSRAIVFTSPNGFEYPAVTYSRQSHTK